MTLENWDEEVAARLTTLEFMVEVLMARELSEMPQEVADLMLSELNRLRDQFHSNDPGADMSAETIRIMSRSSELSDRFLEKASERADQIRRATS